MSQGIHESGASKSAARGRSAEGRNMKKLLFISNGTKPDEAEYNFVGEEKLTNFSIPSVEAAFRQGMGVTIGVNRKYPEKLTCKYPVSFYNAEIYRNPFNFKEVYRAYRNACRELRSGDYAAIHCNTPVGGIVGRLAGKKMKVGKVIYTAHGFHFYKGAPLLNRTAFKWVEQFLAHWTDAIITINQEDYEAAQKFHLKKCGKVYKVHGVGIALEDFQAADCDSEALRRELGLGPEDIACISAGDLIERKNYETAIRAIAIAQNPAIHYLICGEGPEREKLEGIARELHIEDKIHWLGFRTDIKELLAASDIFLFTTRQEGLPRSMMEAMASGLPCVASRIRGNTDLLEGTDGGFLCDAADAAAFAEKLNALAGDGELRRTMGRNNLRAIQSYGSDTVLDEIRGIFEEEFGGGHVGYEEYLRGLRQFYPAWMRKRREIGVPEDAVLLISVGELNANKNHQVILSALAKMNDERVYYVLCGTGERAPELKRQARQLGMEGRVLLLGYRTDVRELLKASDIFVMPSRREGLSRSIMEAMASGLPCVVSRIRGNTDLIRAGISGELCGPDDADEFAAALKKLVESRETRERMGAFNRSAIREYDVKIVKREMEEIYRAVLP